MRMMFVVMTERHRQIRYHRCPAVRFRHDADVKSRFIVFTKLSAMPLLSGLRTAGEQKCLVPATGRTPAFHEPL